MLSQLARNIQVGSFLSLTSPSRGYHYGMLGQICMFIHGVFFYVLQHLFINLRRLVDKFFPFAMLENQRLEKSS